MAYFPSAPFNLVGNQLPRGWDAGCFQFCSIFPLSETSSRHMRAAIWEANHSQACRSSSTCSLKDYSVCFTKFPPGPTAHTETISLAALNLANSYLSQSTISATILMAQGYVQKSSHGSPAIRRPKLLKQERERKILNINWSVSLRKIEERGRLILSQLRDVGLKEVL